MDIQKIVAELKHERERLNQAIAALEGIVSSAPEKAAIVVARAKTKKKIGGLTAEGRKRLSDLMKKRWAERRKKK